MQGLKIYLTFSEHVLVCFKNYLMINYGLACSGFTSENNLHGKIIINISCHCLAHGNPLLQVTTAKRHQSLGGGQAWPGSDIASEWLARAMGLWMCQCQARQQDQRRQEYHEGRGAVARELGQGQWSCRRVLRANTLPVVSVSSPGQWIQDPGRI